MESKILIAWDWNSTLIADTKAVLHADALILTYWGHRPRTLKELQEHFETPISKYYQNIGVDLETDIDPALRSNQFTLLYEHAVRNCRTRRGAKIVLAWLKENKVDNILLSNHRQPDIEKHLDRLCLREFFIEVLANQMQKTSYQKITKPDKLANYIKEHDYDPKNVWIIGDTLEEIEIARQLGISVISISGGMVSVKRLKKAQKNGDYLIHCLDRVIPIIRDFIAD